MTTYTDQFGGESTGSPPTGWTNRYATSSGFTVENPSDGLAEDDRAFRHDDTADGDAMWSLDAIDGDGGRDECEVLGRFRVDSDANAQMNLWARASGLTGDRTGYFMHFSGGTLRLTRMVADSGSTLSSSFNLDVAVSPWWEFGSDVSPWGFTNILVDTWLWFRFRVNGTGATVSLSCRCWVDGMDEPDWWQIEVDDTDGSRITAAGWCGWSGTPPSSDVVDLDYFSVGTGGDSPAIATSLDLAEIRNTQTSVSVIVQEADPVVRVTGVQVSAIVKKTDPEMRLTGSYIQVVETLSPAATEQSPIIMVVT